MCFTTSRIHRFGSNARFSSPIIPREAANTAPMTAVCQRRSRPNTSAWSRRSSTSCANANAIHAPTNRHGPAAVETAEWKLRDVSRRGLVRRRSCSVKCASSLNSRRRHVARVDHCLWPRFGVVVKLLDVVEEEVHHHEERDERREREVNDREETHARASAKCQKTRGWKNRRRTCCGTRRGRRSTPPLWSATPCPASPGRRG